LVKPVYLSSAARGVDLMGAGLLHATAAACRNRVAFAAAGMAYFTLSVRSLQFLYMASSLPQVSCVWKA
jgi:hypothetical protein